MTRCWWLGILALLAFLGACIQAESALPEVEVTPITGPAFIYFYTEG
ncbi:MAG: hypothetical protein H6658_00540 [Ardenticatenaceae bacterium]|nr:hypothetical protein [Ardenticatenaceae bacterium]